VDSRSGELGRSEAAEARRRLLDWYDRSARALPWRAPPGAATRTDPYHVWLSEVMLQQTTVPHATPYFMAFTRRWPTVSDLAAAEDAEVMAAWAGLGYYARARNLLKCARAVAADHGGRFPATEAELLRLPGVGPYTAAAVAAIAFDQPANVVDGNVERVMSRLFAIATPLPAGKSEVRERAAQFVGPAFDRHGDWAQALMDLGATVCRPGTPDCGSCPLSTDCAARSAGSASSYPRKAARAERPHRHGVAWVLRRGGDVALVRRPARGLLGGMEGLPTSDWRDRPWTEGEALAGAPMATVWSLAGSIEHVFTHFSLTLDVYVAVAGEGWTADGLLWRTADDAGTGLPSVFVKALRRGLA
jgi:A/G-specific adenine glycosylase